MKRLMALILALAMALSLAACGETAPAPAAETETPAAQTEQTKETPDDMLLLSRFSLVRLCDPIDGTPPGSAIPGILQARILEWVAISFSNA